MSDDWSVWEARDFQGQLDYWREHERLLLHRLDLYNQLLRGAQGEIKVLEERIVAEEADGLSHKKLSIMDRCRELFEQSTQAERDAYLDRPQPEWLKHALADAYVDRDGKLAYHSETKEANPDE